MFGQTLLAHVHGVQTRSRITELHVLQICIALWWPSARADLSEMLKGRTYIVEFPALAFCLRALLTINL